MMQWISVKERLPEKGGHYLTLQGKTSTMSMNVYRWRDWQWHGAQVGTIVTGITHWMPLPEPPKE